MSSIAVIGPGAVGVTFGAAAERAGHDVVLYGRAPGPAPVLELPGGREQALASAVRDDPAAPVPWVLLATKTHQTATAAPALRALANGKTTIVVLQNGVEHRALTEPHAAGTTIVPGIVWCPSERLSPERTIQRGPARVSVPDDDAGRAFATLMGEAAEVVTVPDFRTEAWRKLMLNATAAPMVTEARRAEVFREPEHFATAQALAEEGAEVARAEGAAIGPGDVEEVLATLTTMPPDLGTSMLFDRLAGRRLEWDARNGVVARRGREHGIATPVTDAVCARLAALDAP